MQRNRQVCKQTQSHCLTF